VDDGTTVGVQPDQALGREITQCLAYRSRADPHLLSEIRLDQALSAGHPSGEDGLPQGVADELMSRPTLVVADRQLHGQVLPPTVQT
jgi:hypothetical protein